MSDDELEKLAAEMQNISPSETARKRGMDAAMAAFDMEFAREAVSESTEEKNSNLSQGLANAPRPTGQSTFTERAQTLGRETMTRFSNVMNNFKFTPRAAMMGGSCMAALVVSMVFYDAGQFGTGPVSNDAATQVAVVEPLAVEPVIEAPTKAPLAPKAVATADTNVGQSSDIKAEDLDQIVVTASKAADRPQDSIASLEGAIAEFEAPKVESARPTFPVIPRPPAPPNSISDLLNNAKTPSANENKEADNAIREYRAVLQQKDNIELFAAQQETLSQPQKVKNAAPSAIGQTPPSAPQITRQSANRAQTNGDQQAALSGRVRTVLPESSASESSSQTKKLAGLTLEEIPGVYETVEETVVTQEASTELITIPATYETVTETVVVQPQSVDYVAVPPKYEWVEGDIEGHAIEYETKPAEYETVSELVVVQEASTELVSIPATFETVTETIVARPEYVDSDGSIVPAEMKQVHRRVVKTPASTQERIVPAVTKMKTRRVVKTPAATIERIVPYEKRDGKTRVVVTPGKTVERAVPAVTKQVTRRVVKTPARTQERVRPANPRRVQRQALVTPPKYYLRDENGQVVREFASRDAFEIYKANLPTSVEEKPVSTFSIDVDTASYSYMRSSLNRGQLPPRSSIRLEEMINYFPYDYEAPKSADEPFKANVTVTPNPWNADTKLMHIGIKGYVPPANERPRRNIVFLIDTSGSMNHPTKLPLLINSFKLLLNTLDADDTVSIVTYAGRAGTVLEPTPASDKHKIKEALTRLRAGGSTAGGAGLELAYQKAQESFDDEGVNRVILATDGDFNVGFSSPAEMKSFIAEKRETGIFLSVLGFGQGNYKDDLMQSLAQNGNGVAAYIDTLSEANKVLADEAGSALFTIAKDVKIQVEFNPNTISEYRLIGYETRALKRQDFNNDKVDAGEIGAGHMVTAIYELTPVGSPAKVFDPLRYVDNKLNTTGSNEFAFVKIRHKLPNSDTSTLQTFPIGPKQERSLKRSSDDMRFATAVAAVGQKLRGDTHLEDFSYDEAIKLAASAKGEDEHGYRAEFIQLIRLAKGLKE